MHWFSAPRWMAIGACTLLVLAGALALTLGAAGAARPPASTAPPRCPAHPPESVTNRWPPTRTKLAPKGASEIRLCRYSGFEPGSGSKVVNARLLTRRTTVRKLVNQFDQLHSLAGAYSCPVDNGAQILARLSYPGRHRDTISVGLGGCDLVANGHVNRTTMNVENQNPAGPRLLAELKRLVG